jgi:hypothetical protein
MVKKRSFLLAIVLVITLVGRLFVAVAVSAQEPQKEKKILKNDDVVMMVQNHFDDDTLVRIIEVSDTDFDISTESLIALKNQGISSTVLRAMLDATQRKKLEAAAPATPPARPAPAPAAPSAAAPTAAAPVRPAPAGSVNPISMMQGMGMNPQQLAGMQSQMAALSSFGGMLSGMFSMPSSMPSYTAEQMPHVFLMPEVHNGKQQEISPSMAQIAQTKFKSGAPSAGGMALRSLATEGLSFAAMAGGPAGMMAMSAFSMASGFMPGMRPGAPSMTYVWGLPGRKSSREFTDTTPIFQLHYGDIPGVDPDAFEPAVVKLYQSKDNYRLVGATRSKLNAKNMMSGGGPENGKWISEERWPTRVDKEERGFYVMRVDQPLEPGEYAVVLRPVKGYKATPSGLGGHAQVFYSVWDFSVPGATPEDYGKK